MRKDVDILKGPIGKNLFLFTIPIVLTGLLQLFYNMADVIVVGRFAGKESLAAVGSTGSLINLFVTMFMGLSSGASVCVAQYIGANDKNSVDKAVHTSIGIAVLGGVILAILGVWLCKDILFWMDVPLNILDETALYMKIIFLGMPANLVYNFGAGILRASGDSKNPLIFLSIAGLVNVVLNLVLVICFDMGAEGVGTATVISQCLSAIMILYFLAKKHPACKLYFRKIRIHGTYLLKIMKIGIPASVQGVVFSLSNVLIQSSVNSFGSAVIAGRSAAGNICDLCYVSMNGVHHAMITFVGQNVGAHRMDRVKKAILAGCAQVSVIGIVLSILIYMLGRPLMNLYVPGEADVMVVGLLYMKYLLPLYFVCGIMDTLVGAQRGMGTSFVPMVASIIGVCGIRIVWIYTVFASLGTLQSLFASYPASWAVTASIQALLCMMVYKKLKKKIA